MPSETAAMDEALKSRLTQYLDHLDSAVRQGGDFVTTQAPDVVNQMVAYHLGFAAALCVFGLLILASAAWVVRWVRKNWEWICANDDEPIALGLGFPLIGGLATGGLIMIAVNLDTLLKCWLAPKYFILEQIISLAK